MRISASPPRHDNPGEWTTLIEGTDDLYLTGFELYRDFYVVESRVRGLDTLEIVITMIPPASNRSPSPRPAMTRVGRQSRMGGRSPAPDL
jgi:protease II